MTQDATQDTLLKLLSEYDGGVLVTLKKDGQAPAVQREPRLRSR